MNKPPFHQELEQLSVAKPADPPRNKQRKKLFIALGLFVAKAGVVWLGYDLIADGGKVETDNAYVGADTAAITPLVSGHVGQVLVSDAQTVRAGQVLVVLDQTDARIALREAEAAYDQARRRVRGYFATDRSLAAQTAARSADAANAASKIVAARADYERTRIDYSRRLALADTGAVSGEELSATRSAFEQARASLTASQAAERQAQATRTAADGQREANLAMVQGASADRNPEVEAARARLERARTELARTVIRAPLDGIVAKRQVQIGQRVQPGSALMSVVPVQAAWVDANFKEGQLKDVRPGQKVKLHADLYGDDVTYHGRVEGLGGGTGSAFALIPAQNATGNWIKVVQRVPVRIRLDSRELARNPLRVGLSMTAVIDTKA